MSDSHNWQPGDPVHANEVDRRFCTRCFISWTGDPEQCPECGGNSVPGCQSCGARDGCPACITDASSEPVVHRVDHAQHPHFTEYIEVPFTAAEIAIVKQAAAERGLGTITWARKVLRGTSQLATGEVPAVEGTQP